jgi:isochorismate synthase
MDLLPVIKGLLDRDVLFAAFNGEKGVEVWVSRSPDLQRIPWNELNDDHDSLVISPFKLENSCACLKGDVKLHSRSSLSDLEQINDAQSISRRSEEPPICWERAAHIQAVTSIRSEISNGTIEKVVLSRVIERPLEKSVLADLFMLAIQEQKDAFVCLFNSGEYGTWLGASPETLIEADDHSVRMDALAGTMVLTQAPKQAIDWGRKERDEQEFVTRNIIDILEKEGLERIEIDGPHVLLTSYAAHLHSIIQADRSGRSLSSLVTSLHPTAAVCGTPKSAAMEMIARVEPDDRGLYAGFWGPWQVNGHTHLRVNIRCMRWIEGHAYLHVGGGITAGSDPDLEWEETEQKAQAWLRPMRSLEARIS